MLIGLRTKHLFNRTFYFFTFLVFIFKKTSPLLTHSGTRTTPLGIDTFRYTYVAQPRRKLCTEKKYRSIGGRLCSGSSATHHKTKTELPFNRWSLSSSFILSSSFFYIHSSSLIREGGCWITLICSRYPPPCKKCAQLPPSLVFSADIAYFGMALYKAILTVDPQCAHELPHNRGDPDFNSQQWRPRGHMLMHVRGIPPLQWVWAMFLQDIRYHPP